MLGLNEILSAKNLAILTLSLSSNFLPNLFSCQVRKVFETSQFAKHVLGFCITFAFITLLEGNPAMPIDILPRFKLACFVYGWFVMSQRMDLKYWTVLILCIAISYLISINKETEMRKEVQDKEFIAKLEKYQDIVLKISFGITIIGFLSYFSKKRMEYGSGFSYEKFLLGKLECK